jgi:hypothetical protein
MKVMSEKVGNQKPFDVQNNINLFENQLGYHHQESLIKWVKKQPNFKGIIPFHFTPIVESQKEYDLFKFEIDSYSRIDTNSVKRIPTQLVEITTNKDCKINSITMVVNKNGKQYKVISKKDYGIIKSRYLLDSKGSFKNYEKCDLVPFDGEYKEYRWNNKGYGDDNIELNKVFNYKNGVKHGECKTYYKGDYPYHRIGNNIDENKRYWYEMFSYVNGIKEGLYENTKFLERGYLLNGKRVGEWIVRISDDIWIPNFSERYKKDVEEQETHRIKCNYMDYKLEGKWEGITMKEFFGIEDEDKIGKVGGEFKNGIMDGEFYSEFWNGKYHILQGKYKNNTMDGNWYEKSSEGISPLHTTYYFTKDKLNELREEGKLWCYWNKKGREYLSSDEVDDYKIITSLYRGLDGKRGNQLGSTHEIYKNRELVSVKIENLEGSCYTIKLEKGINPFHEYTKNWIPSSYENKGLSITSYMGRKDGKDENERIQFQIHENNVFGYNGFCGETLLEFGYPFTHEGKSRYDKRKIKTYPTLPSMKDDLYELGKYYSSDYQYGEKSKSLTSIDGEVFEGEFRSRNSENFKSKKEEVTKKVVNLLKERREKELEEIKKKDLKEFSLFPMD